MPRPETLTGLFRDQVEKTPDHPALVCGEKTLSYRQLDERSSCLAGLLRRLGVKPGEVVALLVDRSFEMVIGLWGILKAGCAYLPLSPGNPARRTQIMLLDSRAPVLLTQGKFLAELQAWPTLPLEIVNLEKIDLAAGGQRATDSNLESPVNPSNPAYLIYTSGSTGQPKGVLVEHRSVVNRLAWMQQQYPLTGRDLLLQKTPYFFDVSVWELFWWVLAGAGLVLLPPGHEKFPLALTEAVAGHGVTVIHFVPSMLSAFLNYMENAAGYDRLKSLRWVFCSGETLKTAQVERFNSSLGLYHGTRLVNLYGPTEATVDVSFYDCPLSGPVARVPIGKAIDNIGLHIVGEDLDGLPVGEAGELCISGIGVARGYLNRPELTAERFVGVESKWRFMSRSIMNRRSPSGVEGPGRDSPTPDVRLYRTGDLARCLPDGNIEFLGRLDQQVKIRGLRIELEEIEAVLAGHPAVLACAVKVKETGDTLVTLVAYLVGRSGQPLPEAAGLRAFLSENLPDYMIPAEYISLAAMPHTASGKIDRKAL